MMAELIMYNFDRDKMTDIDDSLKFYTESFDARKKLIIEKLNRENKRKGNDNENK